MRSEIFERAKEHEEQRRRNALGGIKPARTLDVEVRVKNWHGGELIRLKQSGITFDELAHLAAMLENVADSLDLAAKLNLALEEELDTPIA